MIKGIGIDIVAINRIEKCIVNYGDRFLKKVFTDSEIQLCNSKAHPAVHFAGRWAAKEAFYKALPLSCQSLTSWKDMQILASGESSKPVIDICCRTLVDRIKREGLAAFSVSISHEQEYCTSFVIIE